MTTETLHRFATADDLAHGVAVTLLGRLEQLQEGGRVAQLCLTGGRIANHIYASLGLMVEGSHLDPARLELWWGDERFLPTSDPDRNAGETLAILAGHFPLAPSRTHPMPAADGLVDNVASAVAYAKELGDTVFDICLLGLGADGHVASIFPGHASFAEVTHTVIGVDDSPKPPVERISLTLPALRRSREVWFLVSGSDKADAVARSVAGDASLPAGVTRGTEGTVWFLDSEAAAGLPYHRCSF